jgi:hypothetical protein
MKKSVIIFFLVFFIAEEDYAVNLLRACIKGNDIEIIWNREEDTCSKFLEYRLYAKVNQQDTFTKIVFIKNNIIENYIHINAKNISTKWIYYLEAVIECGGTIIKNSDSLQVDIKAPGVLDMDSVSVAANGVEIGWQPAKENDVRGYILYYEDDVGNNIIIDTIEGKNKTFYLDTLYGKNAQNKSIKYRISVFDSCYNKGVISDPAHNTIQIALNYDTCNTGKLMVAWNRYAKWKESETEYQIFVQKDGLYKKEESVNGYILNKEIEGLENKKEIEIFVRAVNTSNGYSSSSDKEKIIPEYTEFPDYIYIKNVDVKNKNIEISIVVEKKEGIDQIVLFRDEIRIQDYTNIAGIEIEQEDMDLSTDERYYYYQARMKGFCPGTEKASNRINSILLQIEEEKDSYKISWNTRNTWLGNVQRYILKSREDNKAWNEIEAYTTDKELIYKELKEDMKGRKKCFQVEVFEGESNPYGFKEESRSNIVCIVGDPIVWIPNAIMPLGENAVFIPEGKNIEWEESIMTIYNRWGEKIYEETGIEEGWNENTNKGVINTGTYYYSLLIVGENGKTEKFNGIINVIR